MENALNSFGSLATLAVDGKKYRYHSLQAFAKSARIDLSLGGANNTKGSAVGG